MSRSVEHPVTESVVCAGEGCDRRSACGAHRRSVAVGSRLCAQCRTALESGLRRLPTLHEECGRLLVGSERPRERTSGGSMPGMPFNATAADVRATIRSVLSSWGGMVVDERGGTAPRRDVRPLVEFLAGRITWLAAHPAAAELSAEIAELVRSAHRVISPERTRRMPVGACVERGCGGTLEARIPPGASATVSCDADEAHVWPEREWLDLGGRMDERAAPRWLGVAEIARLWPISAGSVYRLASEQKWRRASRGGKKFYHEADVRRALENRRTPVARR